MTFRLQNSKLLLTYKTHLDKAQYTDWISSLKGVIEELYIGHEKGETEYEHTHVAVRWAKAFTSSKASILDYNGIHPNITKVRSGKEDWKKVVKYVAKQDAEVVLPKQYQEDYSLCDDIWSEKKLSDVYRKYITDPAYIGQAMGLEKIYSCKSLNLCTEYITEDMLFEWQKALIEEIHETKPDFRKIYWYVDYKGNTGKTMLCNYLTDNWPEKYAFTTQCGAMRDFATIYENAVKSGWEGHCFLFDLARDDIEHKIYKPIECVKNGRLTSVKYSGKSMRMNHAHVIVFANWLPRASAMSMDRWIVRELKDGVAVPITLSEERLPQDFDV